MQINANEIEARILAKVAERKSQMTEDARIKNAFRVLISAKGRTFEVAGTTRKIEAVRLTYGAGLQLTLDRPMPGKTSTMVTFSARMETAFGRIQASDIIETLK